MRRPTPHADDVIRLAPASRVCARGGRFYVRFAHPEGDRVLQARVYARNAKVPVAGPVRPDARYPTRILDITGTAVFGSSVARLRRGTWRVLVVARLESGLELRRERRYRTCPKRRTGARAGIPTG